MRQVDILVTSTIIGKPFTAVVECKCFNKNVDVKTVDSFVGFVDDVKANLGIIVTNVGFTAAAKNRATQRDIKLDIVKFTELDKYEPEYNWCDCDGAIS